MVLPGKFCPGKRLAGVAYVGTLQREGWARVMIFPRFIKLKWTQRRGARLELSWEEPVKKPPVRSWELQRKEPMWGEPHTQGLRKESQAASQSRNGPPHRKARRKVTTASSLPTFSPEGTTGSEKRRKSKTRQRKVSLCPVHIPESLSSTKAGDGEKS